ncbi:DUF6783 domain-containing protein [Otoolea muris]|uniref:DUF6783 domain-containing protein n=1 Tax=Otoolea muris TaxID=2941515 RepID=UPI003A7F5B19
MKIHSWHLHAPLRGIFVPNSLNAAHCAAFIWHKSPTKWHAQLPESNFQTRSRVLSRLYLAKLRRINFHQQGGEGRRCGGIVDRRQHSLMEI